MLAKVPSLITPALYQMIYNAGHGSTIVIVDAFFPAHSQSLPVVEVPNVDIATILDVLLPYCPPDHVGGAPFYMMAVDGTAKPSPEIMARYQAAIDRHWSGCEIAPMPRFDFYTHTKNSFGIIKTTDETAWANISMRIGVPGARGSR